MNVQRLSVAKLIPNRRQYLQLVITRCGRFPQDEGVKEVTCKPAHDESSDTEEKQKNHRNDSLSIGIGASPDPRHEHVQNDTAVINRLQTHHPPLTLISSANISTIYSHCKRLELSFFGFWQAPYSSVSSTRTPTRRRRDLAILRIASAISATTRLAAARRPTLRTRRK